MKILIVDDQISVIQGLLTGISWTRLGIEQVFTALSALEARVILEQEKIHLMLCDIEMPSEDGLSLIRWVQNEKMNTKYILLTSHASFRYAQEGIKLGCSNYIVQPASYEEISQAVLEVIDTIKEETQKQELSYYGVLLNNNKTQIARNLFHNFILDDYSKKQLNAMIDIGQFPNEKQKVYLGLFQIVMWNQMNLMNSSLLTDSLDNIGSEIFGGFQQNFIISEIDKNSFAFLIWGNEQIDKGYMEHQLQFFNKICQQFLKCSSNIYFEGAIESNAMAHKWKQLVVFRADMTSGGGIIHKLGKRNAEENFYQTEKVRYWGEMLRSGYSENLETEAKLLIDNLVEKGSMNAVVLRRFYQDFLQAAYYAAETLNMHLCDMFHTEEASKLYLDGFHSIEQMKALIEFITRSFKEIEEEKNQSDIVKKVVTYINSHLETELRRDELAEYTYVHPDYLTKIFKKEMGISLKEYVIKAKMEEAKSLLIATELPIGVIAAMVGFFNFSHFSQTYKKVMGVVPGQERQTQ